MINETTLIRDLSPESDWKTVKNIPALHMLLSTELSVKNVGCRLFPLNA